MPRTWQILLSLLIVIAIIVADQASKVIAYGELAGSPPVLLLGGIVRFEYCENAGGLLGLGAGLPEPIRFLLMTAVVGVLLVVGLILLLRGEHFSLPQAIILALGVGGGISNLIDRLRNQGQVIDYVSIGIGPLRTGIFNLADVAVMAGLFLLVFMSVRSETSPQSPADASPQ